MRRLLLGAVLAAAAAAFGARAATAQAKKPAAAPAAPAARPTASAPQPSRAGSTSPSPAATPAAGASSGDQGTTAEGAEDQTLNVRGYTYDPAGRSDPFRSLLVRAENRAGGPRPPGIAGIGIDDVTVQGIWKT